MSDKKEVFDHLDHLEEALNQTLSQVSVIRDELEKSLSENATLRMELEKLRNRLADFDTKTPTPSQPNSNLINIYDEGFHVCTNFYGQRRVDDEPCAFCTELIYR